MPAIRKSTVFSQTVCYDKLKEKFLVNNYKFIRYLGVRLNNIIYLLMLDQIFNFTMVNSATKENSSDISPSVKTLLSLTNSNFPN